MLASNERRKSMQTETKRINIFGDIIKTATEVVAPGCTLEVETLEGERIGMTLTGSGGRFIWSRHKSEWWGLMSDGGSCVTASFQHALRMAGGSI